MPKPKRLVDKPNKTINEIKQLAKDQRTPAEKARLRAHNSQPQTQRSAVVPGTNININKGGGSKAGTGIGGTASHGPSGEIVRLGKNQTRYGGMVFNQAHFAGLVTAIRKRGKSAAGYLSSHPGALAQLGMTVGDANRALNALYSRERRRERFRRNRDREYGGV